MKTPAASTGFTLVEIVAAITVVAMVLALGAPQSLRFYESMQFRSAVRETITLLNSARHAAVSDGEARDVVISPNEGLVQFGQGSARFAEGVALGVNSAREVNRDGLGVIRFYPDGGASGGGIDIRRDNGQRVAIAVDWLVGRVTVEFLDAEA